MIDVAVVGGGPAGAFCAYNLARNGIQVSVFDDSHPREKPCGGLITPEAMRYFPFLTELPIEQRMLRKGHYISPGGTNAVVSSKKNPFRAVSRLKFDLALMEMATSVGAEWVKERVLSLEPWENAWRVTTSKGDYHAKVLVGADGHQSLVRKNMIGPLGREDFGFTVGYLLSGLDKDEFELHFLPHRKGYLWVIPRTGHVSIGMGCSEMSLANGLKIELDRFLDERYPCLNRISEWASLIPNVKKAESLRKQLAGKDWVIIGDAAGHVDPITGEGILYALLDGEMAASAIIEKNLLAYDRTWREVFLRRMIMNMKMRKILYNRMGLAIFCHLTRIDGFFNR